MFKKTHEDARLPERATKYSAGFDVFAAEDCVIGAGETKLIGTGIALDDDYIVRINQYRQNPFSMRTDGKTNIELSIEKYDAFMMSHYFALHIRSSLRAKGITSLGTGIIDMDYRDEIKMVVHNPWEYNFHDVYGSGKSEILKRVPYDKPYEIKKGDKIGQLILCRHEGWLLPSEYTKDDERSGGFGSAGK